MLLEERRQLPESMGELFGAALRAYGRRLPLYLGAAVAAIAVQSILAFVFPNDGGIFAGASIVCEALIAAIVTIGVIGDLNVTETRPSNAAVFDAAVQRWWIVTGASLGLWAVGVVTIGQIFAPNQTPLDYFLILPLAVFAGSVSFAPAIAALDVTTRPELLVFSSIGRSLSLSLMRANLGRIVVLSIVALIPTLLETILSDVLHVRNIKASSFLGSVPLDTLAAGPLQAIFTVFYLDFVRRGAASR